MAKAQTKTEDQSTVTEAAPGNVVPLEPAKAGTTYELPDGTVVTHN
jgi:hypothetical protein